LNDKTNYSVTECYPNSWINLNRLIHELSNFVYRNMRSILVISVALLALALINPAAAGTLSLAGNTAEGYFAFVGINTEGDTEASEVISDPNDPKYFNYPKFVHPDSPGLVDPAKTDIAIMYVEPYMFGLNYPDPLYPTAVGTFVSVGVVEAFTEDADFHDFEIGSISWDDNLVNTTGRTILAPGQFDLTLDGTDFSPRNHTKIHPTADGGFDPGEPIYPDPGYGLNPEGRSNRNEAHGDVTLTASNLSGIGLTFEEGVLASLDFTADVVVVYDMEAFPNFPAVDTNFSATGTVTFSGADFAFDVDAQDGDHPYENGAKNRIILNREGTLATLVPVPPMGWLPAVLHLIVLE
jgi:hypothetical protein